jgi:disulfide bond formation protein DsbB
MDIIRLSVAHPLRTVGIVVPATILGALVIESAGYPPCTLCLYQRIPYYSLCVLLLGALLSSPYSGTRRLRFPFLLVVFAILVASAGLGIFHAGVEFALWDGPQGCSGVLDSSNIDNLLASIKDTKVVSCTKASFWVFGLSLSVWNAIISSSLAFLVGLAIVRNKNTT